MHLRHRFHTLFHVHSIRTAVGRAAETTAAGTTIDIEVYLVRWTWWCYRNIFNRLFDDDEPGGITRFTATCVPRYSANNTNPNVPRPMTLGRSIKDQFGRLDDPYRIGLLTFAHLLFGLFGWFFFCFFFPPRFIFVEWMHWWSYLIGLSFAGLG